jgi:hypothetical protein
MQPFPESDQHLANFDRRGCEGSVLCLRAKITVDRPLKVGFEFIRLLDRHRHIAREIPIGRAAAPFRDERRERVRCARDLIRESAPLSCKEAGERGGLEGKHVGFLPYLEFSKIRHWGNLAGTLCKSVIISPHVGALYFEREREPPALSESKGELKLELELAL